MDLKEITLDTPIKFLTETGRATHANKKSYPIGRWLTVPRIKPLVMCESGYHVTLVRHWACWANAQLYLVEPSRERIEGDTKWCCRSIRLTRRLETWNPRSARLLACEIAESVLPLFERQYPDDSRPRRAIELSRLFARGQGSSIAMGAAGDAAWDAARAAWDAARAAWATAGDAAWDAARAARTAAWDAAWDAARAAAWDAARTAAWATAGATARTAAWATAGEAAGEAAGAAAGATAWATAGEAAGEAAYFQYAEMFLATIRGERNQD